MAFDSPQCDTSAAVFISTDGALLRKNTVNSRESYIRLVLISAGEAEASAELATLYLETGDVAILRAEDNWQIRGDAQTRFVDLYVQNSFLSSSLSPFMLRRGLRALFQFEPPASRLTLLSQGLWNEITVGFNPTAAAQEKRFSQLNLDLSNLAEALRICREIESELSARVPYYEMMVLSHLIRLVTLLARAYLSSPKLEENSQDYQAMHRVIRLLIDQYAKPWQLDELCAIAHMSKSKLVNLFHHATGKTPIEYLIFVRLTNAMKLLQNTDRSITEIAYKTGFSDSNYFSRQFKKYVGVSPSEYRKQSHQP